MLWQVTSAQQVETPGSSCRRLVDGSWLVPVLASLDLPKFPDLILHCCLLSGRKEWPQFQPCILSSCATCQQGIWHDACWYWGCMQPVRTFPAPSEHGPDKTHSVSAQPLVEEAFIKITKPG